MNNKKTDDSGENNIFWITMTDLMTAFVLVFMVLFFYSYMQMNYDKFESKLEQERASAQLEETLKSQNIDASVDALTGTVKISDLSLFAVGDYTLSPSGKSYLSKFAPSYFNSIFKNEYLAKNVEKIAIVGHTDSQTYKGKYSADQQYMKNMDLSLKRAYEVANFMANTPYNKVNGEKLRKMIIVEGASYSEPVLVNGKENFDKSRRVELRLIMKNNKRNKKD